MIPRPPRPTLSPYTTLFRSPWPCPASCAPTAAPGPRYCGSPAHVTSRASAVASSWLKRMPYELATALARRSEEHTSELQSHSDLVCRLLLEKKKKLLIAHAT